MDHSLAKNIFEEIQSRPFSVATEYGVACNNCYYKGMELLQKLAGLGYAVRGQIGEMRWDKTPVPREIISLMPPDIVQAHFYPEVMQDGVWRIIDPTLQPELRAHGFSIGAWEGTEQPCFSIARLYTQEESIRYQSRFFDQVYSRDFFTRGQPAWRALNLWLARLIR